MNKNQIQSYINNFRRHITPFLRPGIGITCRIYPAKSGGAVLVFQLGTGLENDDLYQPESSSLGNALSKIEQRAFGGHLDGISFGGTNVILEQDKLIFIKDSSSAEWSDRASEKDVLRVTSPHSRGGRP